MKRKTLNDESDIANIAIKPYSVKPNLIQNDIKKLIGKSKTIGHTWCHVDITIRKVQ